MMGVPLCQCGLTLTLSISFPPFYYYFFLSLLAPPAPSTGADTHHQMQSKHMDALESMQMSQTT